VKHISEGLASRGFLVEVLTTDSKGCLAKEESVGGVKVRRLRSWAPDDAFFFSPALAKAARKTDADIMHVHGFQSLPAPTAILFAKQTQKLVFTLHSAGSSSCVRLGLRMPYNIAMSRIVRNVDRIICVSKFEFEYFRRLLNLPTHRFEVIPNGINTNEFEALHKNRSSNGRVLLYAGRLEKYKGIHYVIRALPRLDEQVRLEIVGKGPFKNELSKLVETLGVGDRVKFYQDLSREQLLRKYSEADLFVLLSEYESYGIVVAEALASGTACLVAARSGLTEWIDNENCFGINYPIDLNQLSTAISEVAGRKARNPRPLDWDDVTNTLIDVYEEIVRK